MRCRDALLGFDIDHRHNLQVCRQLGKLIVEPEQEATLFGYKRDIDVAIWDGPKDIEEAAYKNVSCTPSKHSSGAERFQANRSKR